MNEFFGKADRISRRGMLVGSGAALALGGLTLSGCAGGLGLDLAEVIRRLLGRASTNALNALMSPGGFYDNELARLSLPEKFGGEGAGDLLGLVLNSGPFRKRLQKELNRVAEFGARQASPIIADAVRNVGIENAAAIVKGGPEAATAMLKDFMAGTLVGKMLPSINDAMRIAQDDVVSQALKQVAGFDLAGVVNDVSTKADNSIWRAIGREEAAIRANPQSTEDALLIGVFGIGSKYL